MKSTLKANKNQIIDKIDNRIYGSFIEHLGRAVYGGIYEPTHESADDMGFRRDVLKLINELNVPIVRYPGGNFVSGYNWEDGIGEKSKRPKKMDLAWLSVETNEVGIDEFQEWAKRANTQVMMAVNLGTRGPDEARNCIEYCNSETDTYYANLRRKNGFEKPFNIKTWCLGNEMDGDWQICHKTAEEYGRVATETAKVLKWVDPSVELVACGSAGPGMPTFGEWERTVLDHVYNYVEYLSMHCYYGNEPGNTPDFLARAEDMDKFIKTTAKICDEVKAKKKSDKTVNLSFDEWNVWYRTRDEEKTAPRWKVAPPLLEEIYNFEDALLVGGMLMTLQNNCDRVKIACIAQLVNVIAPIMTENDGKAWLQTIFYPFMYASAYGRGVTLKSDVQSEFYNSSEGWEIPYLISSVIDNEDKGEIVIFAENRSLDSEMSLDIAIEGYESLTPIEHIELYCDDLKAINTKDASPLVPKKRQLTGTSITLKKHSWNMLRYKYGSTAVDYDKPYTAKEISEMFELPICVRKDIWTDNFYYEIKYISDGTTKGVAYVDGNIESTYREYNEQTLFYICKEYGQVIPKSSEIASNENKDRSEKEYTCEMCKYARREECFPREKICPDFEKAYEVSKEERERWPEYGDATWFKLHGKK